LKTKDQKKKEAQERQEKYSGLSLDKKLAKAIPGSKEFKKLQLAKESAVKENVK
jgi:hypothetical protein